MPIPLMLALSLTALLGSNVSRKYFSSKDKTKFSGGFVFNAIGGLIAALILVLWDGVGAVSTYTLIFGILFGAATAFQGITNLAALQCGPMSYTTVIISFAALIPTLSGALFFNESLGWAQIVGIILMLISFVLATEKGKDEKNASLKWLTLCILSFLGSGIIGVMQKVHQSSLYSGELNAFLIFAFLASAVFCTAFAFILRRYENKSAPKTEIAKSDKIFIIAMILIMLINGVCITVNNKFNLYLSGVMDSAVFFPISGGGGLVLTTLAALIFFRERLTKKQWFGVVIGIVSVVFLCNPFS